MDGRFGLLCFLFFMPFDALWHHLQIRRWPTARSSLSFFSCLVFSSAHFGRGHQTSHQKCAVLKTFSCNFVAEWWNTLIVWLKKPIKQIFFNKTAPTLWLPSDAFWKEGKKKGCFTKSPELFWVVVSFLRWRRQFDDWRGADVSHKRTGCEWRASWSQTATSNTPTTSSVTRCTSSWQEIGPKMWRLYVRWRRMIWMTHNARSSLSLSLSSVRFGRSLRLPSLFFALVLELSFLFVVCPGDDSLMVERFDWHWTEVDFGPMLCCCWIPFWNRNVSRSAESTKWRCGRGIRD